jgi:hypothetical protein
MRQGGTAEQIAQFSQENCAICVLYAKFAGKFGNHTRHVTFAEKSVKIAFDFGGWISDFGADCEGLATGTVIRTDAFSRTNRAGNAVCFAAEPQRKCSVYATRFITHRLSLITHYYSMKIKIVSFFLLLGCLTTSYNSQAQTADPFQEMQRQMMEMQRQMMKSLQNNPFFGDLMERDGKDTSGFFFRLDTTFSKGGPRSFRMDTTFSNGSAFKFFFQGDTTVENMFKGFGQFFGDMMDMGEGFGWEEDDQADMPKDDGNRPNDDGLLPEERIRQRENQQKADDSVLNNGEKPKTESKPVPKKSKIKTTRI